MNTIERFFAGTFFNCWNFTVVFFANAFLMLILLSVLHFGGALDGGFPVEEFSEHISSQNGILTSDAEAKKLLSEENAWAMILDDTGRVIWEENMPDDLPDKYSLQDVASFSRWYLDDYPVSIWKRADGLLVIGYELVLCGNIG